jgi:hypothetical protein
MKKLFLLTFLVVSKFIFSQGNLQFNQTLLLSTTQANSVLLGTVPAGKTWKIEGFGTAADGYNECRFSFDGSNIAFRAGSVHIYGSSYAYAGEAKGIWIPAGTTLYSLGCSYYRWVSVVEFNIVP